MLRAFVLSLVVAACTGGEPVDTSAGADAGVTATHKHTAATVGAMFGCRKACWDDVPFNACRTQRDSCYKDAADHTGKVQCREMSRECRKIRRTCLEACNPGNQQTTD